MKKTTCLLLWAVLVLTATFWACQGGQGASPTDGDDDTAMESGEEEGEDGFHRDDYDPVLGWILLDTNRAHITEVLNMTADYGVTQVQLSHDLIMDIDEILDNPDKAVMLREVAQEAKAKGLEVVVWAHELTGNTLSVCFHKDDPYWEGRRAVYRAAFEAIPEIDGVVLMFGSASPDPWYALCSCDDDAMQQVCEDPTGELEFPPMEMPPAPKRVALIVNTVADVTEAMGKKLFIRTFIHKPSEQEWMRQGLILAGDRDFIAMSKPVPQDFEPYYPHDSLIGAISDHAHIAEFDMAGEYWGRSQVFNPQVEYVAYRFRHLWSHQGIGAACRIERGSSYCVGTPSAINIYTASRLMDDPAVHPDEVYAGWFAKELGLTGEDPLVAELADIYRLSWEATRKRHYVRGFWALEKGSDLPDEPVSTELQDRSLTLWDEGFDELFEKLKAPDDTTLADIYQEGMESLEAAQEARDRFLAIAAQLDAVYAADLSSRLENQVLINRAWMWAEECIWGNKRYGLAQDDTHRAWMQHAVSNLEASAQAMDDAGRNPPLAPPSRVRSLAEKLREKFPAGSGSAVARDQLLILGMHLGDISATGATVSFRTNRVADCSLHYGVTITHTDTVYATGSTQATDHLITLKGLTPDTLHLVRAVCEDGQETRTGGDWYLMTKAQ